VFSKKWAEYPLARDFNYCLMPQNKTYAEHELCYGLKIRDSAAFSYLYDYYSGALFCEIIRLVRQREVAEDILQETFIQIYRMFEQYDPLKGRLFTWMIIIARNKSIDFLKSAEARVARKTGEINEEIGTKEENTLSNTVDHQLLQRQILQLPKTSRDLVRLVFVQGHTHQEVSNIHQIPIGTVKTRLRSALQRLRVSYPVFQATPSGI